MINSILCIRARHKGNTVYCYLINIVNYITIKYYICKIWLSIYE